MFDFNEDLSPYAPAYETGMVEFTFNDVENYRRGGVDFCLRMQESYGHRTLAAFLADDDIENWGMVRTFTEVMEQFQIQAPPAYYEIIEIFMHRVLKRNHNGYYREMLSYVRQDEERPLQKSYDNQVLVHVIASPEIGGGYKAHFSWRDKELTHFDTAPVADQQELQNYASNRIAHALNKPQLLSLRRALKKIELPSDLAGQDVRISVLQFKAMTVRVTCPDCHDAPTHLMKVVMHLNDIHKWTREKIADWMDELADAGEINIDLTSPDPDRA